MKETSKCLFILISLSFLVAPFSSVLVKNVLAQEQGKAEVKEVAEAYSTKEGYTEEKEEFKRKADEKLNEFDKKMDELEVKAKEEGSREKEEAKKELQELKEKRAAVKRDMEKLGASSKETWEAAKRKVNDAINELEEGYNKVRSYFK
jgi:chromosome segregation ATPase